MDVPHVCPELELRGLRCVRGSRALFGGVSAKASPGQMLRVQGENGSGKTSLLKMICGLAAPVEGEIFWRGRPIRASGESREEFHEHLVYIGHAAALKDDLSAIENLRASTGLAGLACSKHEAAEALAHAGLDGFDRLAVRMLSQGQRKRVSLARLALTQPGTRRTPMLWVLDEPFDALDADACEWLKRLICAQLARGGVVVLTSHQKLAWDAALSQATLTLSRQRTPSMQ
jgi:heme exporter protein A